MNKITLSTLIVLLTVATGLTTLAADDPNTNSPAAIAPPRVPAFSVDYMDRSVSPATNFYEFADGQWLKNNPVPPDKSRWASFTELAERNWFLIHQILADAAQAGGSLPAHSPRREVGDFFASAMDTNRIEQLGLQPIADDLKKIDAVQSTTDLFALLADFHQRGIGGIFGAGFGPDAKKSSIYAVELEQGGLSLPDRDYYLKDSFADKLKQYHEHVRKMFGLLGENAADAEAHAATVIALETELAKASRTRVELRDPIQELQQIHRRGICRQNAGDFVERLFRGPRHLAAPAYEIVGQPEFFDGGEPAGAGTAAGGLENLSALASAARQRAIFAGSL